jgi:hypothetical protein
LNIEMLEDRALLSTCTVTRSGDAGAGGTIGGFRRGDLRYCITQANAHPGPDLIKFGPSITGSIYLNSALPNVTGDLNIVGPGQDLLFIDAQRRGRPFYIEPGVNLEISNVSIANGYTGFNVLPGGAFWNKGR